MTKMPSANVLIQDSENFRKQLEDSLHDKGHLAGEIEKLRSGFEQFKMRTGSLSEPTYSRTSLQYGIMCLKKLSYDRKELERRRECCQHEMKDVLVWSNDRVLRWVQSIGLRDYANILLESGVHGSLVALDDNFDYSSLALLLQIPNQNTRARQLLEREYNNLLALGTERRLDENNDKNFRGGPSWRRHFHPWDVHGISMMPGSSETLPAGIRLTTTSGQSRNMSSEGFSRETPSYAEEREFAGGKKPMDRITLLCCANMDRTEKLPLLLIGKSKSLRCFPKEHSKVALIYKNYAKAWMTS
ncbi:UNVERIFIED_CONTAM: hypothetical protein FKN15_069752 [Acipenser sinensis]